MGTDMDLVQTTQRGDCDAFDQLWHRYKGFAAEAVRHMLRTGPAGMVEELVNDALQEIRTKLWREIMRMDIRDDGKLKDLSKWITKVIKNKAIDLTHRNRYYREFANAPLLDHAGVTVDTFGWE